MQLSSKVPSPSSTDFELLDVVGELLGVVAVNLTDISDLFFVALVVAQAMVPAPSHPLHGMNGYCFLCPS